MKLCTGPIRLSCAEPLETRRLLSAHAPAAALATDAAVEVVEVAPAGPDCSEDDVEIAPADLPKAVVAALHARFPDAQIVEVAFSSDEGPQYDVAAQVHGQAIDLTFTPSGNVVEMGESVTSDELPQAVRDWVRQDFPGAQIDQAAKVTKGSDSSYELVIATPQNQEMEATVRVRAAAPVSERDLQPPSDVFASAQVHEPPEPSSLHVQAEEQREAEPAAAAVPHVPTEAAHQQAPAAAGPIVFAPDGSTARRAAAAAAARSENPILHTKAAAQAIQAIFVGAQPIASVPEIADALGKAVIADVASLERRLAQTIEIFAERDAAAAAAMVHRSAAGGVATLTIFLAGMQLLRPSRKNNAGGGGGAGQVILTDAANSSWSWVIGTPRWPRP